MDNCLKFYFDKNDPEFINTTIVVNDTPGNYISHDFVKCPIYKKYSCGNIKRIGYKVADDYIQQLDTNKYSVKINSTYYFEDKGTISWQYSFINNVPEVYYPVNKIATSNITSTTGCYLYKNGYVHLLPKQDGIRKVKIIFNGTNIYGNSYMSHTTNFCHKKSF